MIFKPSFKDVIYGQAMEEATGKGAAHRLPQRCLDILTGTISSHCSVLTSNEWIDGYKKRLQLAANIAKVSKVIEDEEERKR